MSGTGSTAADWRMLLRSSAPLHGSAGDDGRTPGSKGHGRPSGPVGDGAPAMAPPELTKNQGSSIAAPGSLIHSEKSAVPSASRSSAVPSPSASVTSTRPTESRSQPEGHAVAPGGGGAIAPRAATRPHRTSSPADASMPPAARSGPADSRYGSSPRTPRAERAAASFIAPPGPGAWIETVTSTVAM